MTQGGTEIGLLGQLRVGLDGRPVEGELRGVQGKLCFAYLALNRDRAVPRAELEDAIWFERPPGEPGAALSTLVSRLRKTLGEGVIAGRSGLRLILPEGSSIDTEAAQEALSLAEQLERDHPARAQAELKAAIHALEEELLPGFDAPWLGDFRRDLQDLRLQALELSASLSLQLGDPASAERTARELVRAHPYRESGHGRLMEALAAQGNTAEALRAYEDLRALLRDELGTAPSRDLAELHRTLLSEDEAVPPALAATIDGWRAQSLQAHERAADHFKHALDLLGETAPMAKRADLMLLRSESLVRAGDIDGGRETVLEAAGVARSIGDGERLGHAALSYGDSGGVWSMRTGDSDPILVSLIEEALTTLGGSHPDIRARLCGRLSSELAFDSETSERVKELSDEAVRLAREVGGAELVSRVLLERAISSWSPRNIDERLALTAEAHQLSQGAEDRSAEANAAMWHGVALAEDAGGKGGWAVPERIAEDAVSEGRNQQLNWLHVQFGINRAIAEGRLEDAGEGIADMLATAPESASDDPQMAAAYSAFLIARERGQLEMLEEAIDQQLAILESTPGLSALRTVLGLALIGLGREREAAEQLGALGADFSQLPADSTWSLGASHAADLIVELGDRDRASTLYEIARAQNAEALCVVGAGVGMLGSMDRYMGLLAEATGNPEASRRHFERAIEVNERKQGLLEAAHSRVDLARVLLSVNGSGNTDADALLAQAIAFADERGDLLRLRNRAEEARTVLRGQPLPRH